MSDVIVQVENLSKRYILGTQRQERYQSFRDVLSRRAKALLLTWQLLSMHQQMLKTPYLLDKSAFRLHSLLLPG